MVTLMTMMMMIKHRLLHTWLKSYLTPLITTFTAPAPPPLPNWDKRTSIAKQTKSKSSQGPQPLQLGNLTCLKSTKKSNPFENQSRRKQINAGCQSPPLLSLSGKKAGVENQAGEESKMKMVKNWR